MKNVLNLIVFNIAEKLLCKLLLFSIYYTFLNLNIRKIHIYKYFINVSMCVEV